MVLKPPSWRKKEAETKETSTNPHKEAREARTPVKEKVRRIEAAGTSTASGGKRKRKQELIPGQAKILRYLKNQKNMQACYVLACTGPYLSQIKAD